MISKENIYIHILFQPLYLIMDKMNEYSTNVLIRKKHINYFIRFLNAVPRDFISLDSQRLVLLFYIVSGLDILDSLDKIAHMKKDMIDWIYNFQVTHKKYNISGFQGSTLLNCLEGEASIYRCGHIANTYAGLLSLLILEDDLSRVNKKEIIESLKMLQKEDGCFTASLHGCESDMRFLYCAACVCYILDDWSGINIDKAVDYILKTISYDYGIAQNPELEAHGGSTYCAVATLALCNQLHSLTKPQLDGLKRWLIMRQVDGFNGRPNKLVDSCYSFWVGASLKILDAFDLSNHKKNKQFILATQHSLMGGFAKWVGSFPDPHHAYLSLAGLSLLGEEGLRPIVPSLNITERVHDHLKELHKKWRSH